MRRAGARRSIRGVVMLVVRRRGGDAPRITQKNVFAFYLQLCNRHPKYTRNSLYISVLRRLQMMHFICNHLPPSATFVWLYMERRASARRAGKQLGLQINLHLQPYLQPCNRRSISILWRFLGKGCRLQMKMKTILTYYQLYIFFRLAHHHSNVAQ